MNGMYDDGLFLTIPDYCGAESTLVERIVCANDKKIVRGEADDRIWLKIRPVEEVKVKWGQSFPPAPDPGRRGFARAV